MSCVRYSSGQNSLLGRSSLVTLLAFEMVVEIEAEDDDLDLKRPVKISRLRGVAVPASLLPLFTLALSTLPLSRLSSHVCCGCPRKPCTKMMLLYVSHGHPYRNRSHTSLGTARPERLDYQKVL